MNFWDNINIQPNGCWLWTGYVDPRGYPKYHKGFVATTAHRFALESFLGRALLPKHDAHHLCTDSRTCICPLHLQEVPKDNHPGGGAEVQRNKTHCIYGHEFTEENTLLINNGRHRCCLTCRSLTARRKPKGKRLK